MRTIQKTLFALAFVASMAWSPRASASLHYYHLYVIWLQGEGEGNKAALDDFIACLFHNSSFMDYWGGQVLVVEEGSYVVPPPGSIGDAKDIGPFIQSLITGGKIPPPPMYGTPIYQVMVDPAKTSTVLGNGTGGRNAVGNLGGQPVGFIINTTNPAAFWPARVPLAGETQLTQHEVAEVIDGLRGGYQCAGDFCCEGWCNNTASCSNFSGLKCPGAPATTFTGSSQCGDVQGWLIQSLSHQGAQTCSGSPACDFKVTSECSDDKARLHAPCMQDADCCAGLSCERWSYTGEATKATTCCKAAGAACTQGSDCCGGLDCDGTTHKCVTVAIGKFCLQDQDCNQGLVCDATNKCAVAPPMPEAGPDAAPAIDASPGADAGTDPPPGDTPSGTDASGSCACRAGATSESPDGAAFAALAILALVRSRTRRMHRV